MVPNVTQELHDTLLIESPILSHLIWVGYS